MKRKYTATLTAGAVYFLFINKVLDRGPRDL